jgi:6-pyruvoyltetrahydropterin/6-carboxytetrahydropterin synthase
MYSITKEIYFCYGHRLMNHRGKCRNLHGHSVKAAITINAEQLDTQGMVCDFADIGTCANDYIEQQLDHNFLLHKDDPIVPLLTQNNERFMVLDEHPTAEVLAKMIFQYIKGKGFNVTQVVLWETASSYACYQEQ